MQNICLNEKKKDFARKIFISVFLIYAILGSNSLTYGNRIITPIMWAAMFFSVVILAYRLLNLKEYFKVPETVIIIAVLSTIGLSTVINRNYSFKNNIIYCVYWVIYFLILFTCEKKKSTKSCKSDIGFVSVVFVSYTTLAVIASFILLFMGVGITNTAKDTNYQYNLGFVWGRLWGVFINPNNGAVSCAVSITMLIFAFISYKKVWKRIVFGVLIFIHLMYIVFSDSRTGAVVLSVSIASFLLCAVLNMIKDKKLILKLLSFVMAIGVAAAAFVSVRELKNITNNTVNFVSGIISDGNKDNKDNIIDRGYDISDDVSNRRFDVWKSGVEVYKNSAHNIIFGLSFCGFTDYARDNMPQTYIVNNDFGDMTTLDNELLNILISNGIIGFLSVAAFVIYIIAVVFKNFAFISSGNKYYVCLMLSIPISLAAAAMFSSVMFFHFSPNTIIFWYLLGRLSAFLINERTYSDDK